MLSTVALPPTVTWGLWGEVSTRSDLYRPAFLISSSCAARCCWKLPYMVVILRGRAADGDVRRMKRAVGPTERRACEPRPLPVVLRVHPDLGADGDLFPG